MKEVTDMAITPTTTLKEFVLQLKASGFQGQHVGEGAEILQQALRENATLFLSFTSNMAASGLRGIIIDLIKRKKVAAIITTSGSFDEDIIRAKLPYLQGSFESDDEALGSKGINRMGNVFVPNDRYEYLDEWCKRTLAKLYTERKEWTPSELLAALGTHVESENSFLYWCSKNNVPVYCPGITDGALGMQLAFFQQKHTDFVVDVVKDFSKIMDLAFAAKKTAALILGGGIAKHHTIISNILNGLDYAVYVNSSSPYHGSLSGATTSEAKSWGKVKTASRSVTIYGDAAIILPLLIGSVENFFE